MDSLNMVTKIIINMTTQTGLSNLQIELLKLIKYNMVLLQRGL